MISVLIAEDEATQRFTLRKLIEKNYGYHVFESNNGKQALEKLEQEKISLVIMDINMPEMDGMEALSIIKEKHPNIPVIMLTASNDMNLAVDAMKIGAIDFLSKPLSSERFTVSVDNVLKISSMEKELVRYRRSESGEMQFSDLIGYNSGLSDIIKVGMKAAQSDIPVLISGETGVGKEVFAHSLHGESNRVGKPFIAINCAAIPESLVESTLFGHEKGSFTGAIAKSLGKFREAEGGTLFLDEIGELPLEVQAKLLRVLQEKEVEPVGSSKTVPINVRIISATNRNLADEVANGNFREDLYFRLDVLPIRIPPLRERISDVPELMMHFINRFAASHNMSAKEISTAAQIRLENYSWNGNVRELENTIHRLVVLSEGKVISADDVNEIMEGKVSYNMNSQNFLSGPALNLIDGNGEIVKFKELEVLAINFAMQFYDGNITKAAKSLGYAKPTFYKRLAAIKEENLSA